MPKQEIKIEFNAIGDKELIKSLHRIANANKKLIKSQKELGDSTSGSSGFSFFGQRVRDGAKNADKGITSLLGSFALLRNKMLLVSFGAGLLVKPLANVTSAAVNQAAKFQSLQVRLSQLFGSLGEGKAAFEQFNAQAAKTPFALEDIVNAGAQFKAFGGNSRELLNEITDLAAFMGTTATEAANSLGRAFAGGAGAADILRERGVLNLVKSFAGVEDLSKLTLPEFRKALIGALQDPATGIAGATEAMADTYIGRLSNMQDATQRMQAALGDLLMPAAEGAMEAITGLANEAGRFFLELGESELETTIRELKDLGIEAKKLAGLEIILNTEKSNEKIEGLRKSVSNLKFELFDLGDFDDMDFGIFDFGDIGTGQEQMAKMNEFLKDSFGQTLKSIEESFVGQGDFFDPTSTESMEEAFDQLTEAAARAKIEVFNLVTQNGELAKSDEAAYQAGQRNVEYLTTIARKIQHLIKIKRDQAELEEYLKEIEAGKDPSKPDTPDVPEIDKKFIDFTKELNTILSKTKEKRLEEVRALIKQHKAYEESGRYRRENSFDANEYKLILDELIKTENKLLGISDKATKKKPPFTEKSFKDEIQAQKKEYENLQKILKSIEESGYWAGIPKHLKQHSDEYQNQLDINEEVVAMFGETEEGQKRNINKTLQLIKAYDGLVLTEEDLVTLTELYNEKLEDVGKTTEDTRTAYQKYRDSIIETTQAGIDEVGYLKDLKDELKKTHPEILAILEAEGHFNKILDESEVAYKAYTQSIIDNAVQTQNNETFLKRFKDEIKDLPADIREAVEALNLFAETDMTKMDIKELTSALTADFKEFESNESLKRTIAGIADEFEKSDPAFSKYLRNNVLNQKVTKETDFILKAFMRTNDGRLKQLEDERAKIITQRDNLDKNSMSLEEYESKVDQANIAIVLIDENISKLNGTFDDQKKKIDGSAKAYGDFELEIIEKVFAHEREKQLIEQLIAKNRDLAIAGGFVKDSYTDLVTGIEDRIKAIKDEQDQVMLLEFRNKKLYDEAVKFGLVQSGMTEYQTTIFQEQQKVQQDLQNISTERYRSDLSTLTHIRSETNRLNLTNSERNKLEGIYSKKVNDTARAFSEVIDVMKFYRGEDSELGLAKGYEEEIPVLEESLRRIKKAKDMTFAEFQVGLEGSMFETDPMSKDAEKLFRAFIFTLGEDEKRIGELLERIKKKIESAQEFQKGLDAAKEIVGGFSNIADLLSQQTQRAVENDIKALRKRDDFINASAEKREDMEEAVRRKHRKKVLRDFYFGQALSVANIAIDTANAVMKTVGKEGFFGMPMAIIMSALGAAQAGIVLAQKPPAYEEGGLIGGRRHSRGGTIIEAERGEFIMRRSAVEQIGISELTRMNNGGGSSSPNIVINNPIISKDFVEDELPSLIKEAVVKGSDFGMS